MQNRPIFVYTVILLLVVEYCIYRFDHVGRIVCISGYDRKVPTNRIIHVIHVIHVSGRKQARARLANA